ncbi:MAG: hypothetical protein ABEJ80_01290 [Halarchaeum sp.]
MSARDRPAMRVECTDCPYVRRVAPDDDHQPSHYLVRHGRRTGHTLTVTRIEDD